MQERKGFRRKQREREREREIGTILEIFNDVFGIGQSV
jgi:hypothetical protein